jgi:uncharacterized membrane protein YbhN (UPF0104 family)
VKSHRAALLLQLAVSLALLVLLARKVPIPEAATALARIQPGTLALCLALALVAYWGRARRWAMLLRRSGVRLPALEAYRLTLVGTFYGLVTPGRVGELARIVHIGAPRSDTLPSVVWDRVVDVLLLEALCLPAFAAVPAWRGELLAIYLGLVVLTVAGIALLSHAGAMRALVRVVPVLGRLLGRWSEHTHGLLHQGVSAASILWGLFFYAFMYAIAGLLLRDVAPHASADLVVGQPVIALLGNLPIALGGLGLREQVSAALFEQYGAGAATGAAYSLLVFTVLTLFPALIGMLASTAWSGRRPTANGARP